MITSIPISVIDEALVAVAAQLPARVREIGNWRVRGEADLWRELMGAILGSAVFFEQAFSALSMLEINGLTGPSSELGNRGIEIENCLRTAHYRFPVIRAQQLARSAAAIYGQLGTVRAILEGYTDPFTARRRLIELCPGLGPKQASLFLRNIGYSDFAVLDRHVLTYLQHRGLLSKSIVTIPSLKMYETLEQIVFNLALGLGLAVSDFDLSVWITVRTASGANRQWES